MVRVLVTRPEPGASRTARRLEDQGFQPLLLPLTRPQALPVDALPGDVAAVAITSANAIRHAPREIVAALAALPCHAVGARTAQAARAAGFLSVDEGPGTAEALADALAGSLSGRSVVYLCGRVRLPAFEARLSSAGVDVRAVETYDTIGIGYADAAVLERLSGRPVDIALVYSARAGTAIRELASRPALRGLFETTRFLALSGRVAAALGDIAGTDIRVASRPDEDALLALVRA